MNDDKAETDDLASRRDERQLVGVTSKVLDESLDAIDNSTLARLKQARQLAASSMPTDGPRETTASDRFSARRWMPATGIAAAVLFALLLQDRATDTYFAGTQTGEEVAEKNVVDDKNQQLEKTVESMSVAEKTTLQQPNVYDESGPWMVEEDLLDDMEFYVWLALQEQTENENAG